jgi:hypothetical protein
VGERVLAQLEFSASPGESVIVPFSLDLVTAWQTNAVAVPRTLGGANRVVVVGVQPVLEVFPSTNGSPALVVYGQPGSSVVVESTSDLGNSESWESAWTAQQTNLFQVIPLVVGTNHFEFFRVKRIP